MFFFRDFYNPLNHFIKKNIFCVAEPLKFLMVTKFCSLNMSAFKNQYLKLCFYPENMNIEINILQRLTVMQCAGFGVQERSIYQSMEQITRGKFGRRSRCSHLTIQD